MKIDVGLASIRNIDAYTDNGASIKALFHSKGKTFLRNLAKELGLPKGSYDIRSNMGGIAVSGEVTLHGESLYVQLSESCVGGPGVGILYRSCKGRKDYTGGTNNWATIGNLKKYPHELERFVENCKRLMQG